MPKFIVRVEESKELLKFVKDTKARLKNPDLLKNPFVGEFNYQDRYILINLNPIYPNISKIGILLAIVIIMFGISLWWLLFTLPFMLVGFLNSKYFYYLGLRAGLRKAGYKGKTKLMRC